MLLVVHGLITLAAGIVLTVAPGLIPSAVRIQLEPSAHVVAYLLAGAEIGFAVLSRWQSRNRYPRARDHCLELYCLSRILGRSGGVRLLRGCERGNPG
jgi:hypothetical protein